MRYNSTPNVDSAENNLGCLFKICPLRPPYPKTNHFNNLVNSFTYVFIKPGDILVISFLNDCYYYHRVQRLAVDMFFVLLLSSCTLVLLVFTLYLKCVICSFFGFEVVFFLFGFQLTLVSMQAMTELFNFRFFRFIFSF